MTVHQHVCLVIILVIIIIPPHLSRVLSVVMLPRGLKAGTWELITRTNLINVTLNSPSALYICTSATGNPFNLTLFDRMLKLQSCCL